MVKLLSAEPGTVRHDNVNQKYAQQVVNRWLGARNVGGSTRLLHSTGKVFRDGQVVGHQKLWMAKDGRFRLDWSVNGMEQKTFVFDGDELFDIGTGERIQDAANLLPVIEVMGFAAHWSESPFGLLKQKWRIDGSDKSQSRVAYRLTVGKLSHRLFVWLQQNQSGKNSPIFKLSKVSPDKDAHGIGGVIFKNWQTTEQIPFPFERQYVKGLGESSTLTVRTDSLEFSKIVKESLFQIPDNATTGEQEK